MMSKSEVKTMAGVYTSGGAGVSDSQEKVVDVFGDEEEHEIKYKTLSWQVNTSVFRASTSY